MVIALKPLVLAIAISFSPAHITVILLESFQVSKGIINPEGALALDLILGFLSGL